ncbi:hypothetical protein [Natronobeatus ordinarius]|uniref:hypothetical protein n=1 Tax=Natronobeatus ordinarius TaxID=2963433 RepID=UPI0020CEEE31|nr:hypothetical protein [Natronobeatus ordinarius]
MRRRNVITSAGALFALGGISTVSGRPDNQPVPAEDAGVEKAVKKLLRKGQHKQVKELLDRHNVNYVMESQSVASDDEASTEGRYSESSSELYLTVVEMSGDDRWLATGAGTLSNRRTRVRDAAIIEDACGITVDTNEWTLLGSDHIWYNADSDGYNGADMEITDVDPNAGVSAEVTLPQLLDDKTTVNLQVELEKTGSVDEAPIFFDYEHTWAYLDVAPSIQTYIETESDNGILMVLLDYASTAWDVNLDAAPGGSDTS